MWFPNHEKEPLPILRSKYEGLLHRWQRQTLPAVDPPTNPDKGLISITGLSLKLEFKAPALLETVTGVQEALAGPKTCLH